MNTLPTSPEERFITELVHELRQPLSNISLGASFLELLLTPDQERALTRVRAIQQEIERTGRILNDACAELRRLRSQSEAEAANFDRTKSETAAVT